MSLRAAVCRRPGTGRQTGPLHLDVAAGEFLVLSGGTGAGKSTVLGMVAGSAPVTAGRVLVSGRDVTALPARSRGAIVLADGHPLQPRMSVAENLALVLAVGAAPRTWRADRVAGTVRALGLEHLLGRTPPGLSTGERRLVALARALVHRCGVLLLDDPLAGLDPALRATTLEALLALARERGTTTLYATSEVGGAAVPGVRVVTLDGGALRETTWVPAVPGDREVSGDPSARGPSAWTPGPRVGATGPPTPR
ncbi:ATP-binding cassette domain-containing protein [Kineococcus sp. NUM-3379]